MEQRIVSFRSVKLSALLSLGDHLDTLLQSKHVAHDLLDSVLGHQSKVSCVLNQQLLYELAQTSENEPSHW